MIGLRLKEERTRLGLTQPVFADFASAKKRTLADWEKGVSSPTAIQLHALSEVGVDVNYVITGNRTSLNSKALQDCIEIIEEVSQETGRIFSPEQKAKLLVILYEDYITDAASITPEKINTYIRLVA